MGLYGKGIFIGVAQHQNWCYIYSMTAEERHLITIYADKVFHGKTIRQEIPACVCGKVYNEKELYDAPGVFFREVDVFGKTFTLIEPLCPVCKRRITAYFNILN
jgi:hypothetical protein